MAGTIRDVPFFALVLLFGDQPGWASAFVLTVAAVCVALFYRPAEGRSSFSAPVVFGRRALQPVYLRQRDPSAAGRPRPRAPGNSAHPR